MENDKRLTLTAAEKIMFFLKALNYHFISGEGSELNPEARGPDPGVQVQPGAGGPVPEDCLAL